MSVREAGGGGGAVGVLVFCQDRNTAALPGKTTWGHLVKLGADTAHGKHLHAEKLCAGSGGLQAACRAALLTSAKEGP